MLSVGIPKEIKTLEKRVGLTPSAAAELVRGGVPVRVETNAGLLSGFSDDDYRKAGAEIVRTAEELYRRADIIQKVKEPQASEYGFLNNKILFSFLHLASPENKPLAGALAERGTLAIAYETVEKEGRYPLLAPMSRIAGALGAAYGVFLEPYRNKKEEPSQVTEHLARIAATYPDFQRPAQKPADAVIFGGGVAGEAALRTLLKLGGKAAVVEKNETRRAELSRLTPAVYDPANIPEDVLRKAGIFVGSVHVRGARAFCVMGADALKRAGEKEKKVIVDISIDQGGNFPEAHATSYAAPLYRDSLGNLRFSVANIPSFSGRGASTALTEATLPYTRALAKGAEAAFQEFPELGRAVNVRSGKVLIVV